MGIVKTFKDYVGKSINESPYTNGIYTEPKKFEEPINNLNEYNYIIANYNKVKVINYKTQILSLYVQSKRLVKIYCIIDESTKMFVAYFMITYLNKNNIQLGGV